MSALMTGLFMVLAFNAVFLLICFGVVRLLPGSFLGKPAKAVLAWLPPFMGGEALRSWAAARTKQVAQERLVGKRTGRTAVQVAKNIEEGAMRAMLPFVSPLELARVITCPEAGLGKICVTAPKVFAISDYLRTHMPPGELERIHDAAVENAKTIASRVSDVGDQLPLPCPLQGEGHMCCVYAVRPLRCRLRHEISIASALRTATAESRAEAPDDARHERTVASGVELGLTRALESAGLDAEVYELNSALATALGTPDAAERWAKGERVFHTPLSVH